MVTSQSLRKSEPWGGLGGRVSPIQATALGQRCVSARTRVWGSRPPCQAGRTTGCEGWPGAGPAQGLSAVPSYGQGRRSARTSRGKRPPSVSRWGRQTARQSRQRRGQGRTPWGRAEAHALRREWRVPPAGSSGWTRPKRDSDRSPQHPDSKGDRGCKASTGDAGAAGQLQEGDAHSGGAHSGGTEGAGAGTGGTLATAFP